MKPITYFVILFIVLCCAPVGAVNQYPVSRLEQGENLRLQQGLESSLADLHLKNAAATKALSIALVDITDPANPRHAYINPNEMMYAASLPKIAILLGAFERISNREMTLDPATQATLLRMIRNSSNQAATEMLNRVGKKFIADLLQSPRYRFYDPEKNGGLWVGKEYSSAVTWKRDPLHNLSHGATVLQVARFYYMLETGQLVSPAYSRQMKSILADSAIDHKFVKGLKRIHPESRIYRKSGTWRNFHADSAIIEHDGRTYIAVALAESPSGGKWLTDLIVCLDNLIFDNGPAIN
jgi:beta-lactamase class A